MVFLGGGYKMVYNVTALVEGRNIAEWALIANSWTSGTLFAAFVIAGSLITFTISYKASGDSPTVAMITTGFIWGLISALLWVIQWNSYTLLPTVIPLLYGTLLGLGALLHLTRGGIGNV